MGPSSLVIAPPALSGSCDLRVFHPHLIGTHRPFSSRDQIAELSRFKKKHTDRHSSSYEMDKALRRGNAFPVVKPAFYYATSKWG